MSSRYSAARPKRAGESFARTHHGERTGNDGNGDDGPSSSKKVRFDMRNPSALAPEAQDDDLDEEDNAVLEADVIGKGGGATKRGAVNIDGYDSDSENEAFHERAEARKKKGGKKGDVDVDVDIADQLDNYDKHLRDDGTEQKDDDEDEDMFAADDDLDEEDTNDPAGPSTTTRVKKKKEVRFLDTAKIEGQDSGSKSGGTIRIDNTNNKGDEPGGSSDDEEDIALAIQEEGIDEEVGLGGLKRHAPKIDAFNMKAEQEEGAFDEAGNFIRKATDPDAVHDRWLEGVSKKDMKKAAEAHEKREAELRRQRKEDDALLTEDLLRSLIVNLEKGETPLEALARLGKLRKGAGSGAGAQKKVPKWKLKKQQAKNGGGGGGNGGGGDAMDVDSSHQSKEATEDPQQAKIREAINTITEAADKLLGREYADIYETEREMLIRDWQTEAGERWVEPAAAAAPVEEPQAPAPAASASSASKMWEYRWTDGRDGGVVQGPYDGPTMKAWQDAGYFEGVEFRAVGEEEWDRVGDFV